MWPPNMSVMGVRMKSACRVMEVLFLGPTCSHSSSLPPSSFSAGSFLHSRLRFGTIWCGGFCSEAERDNLVNMKQSEIEYYLEWTGHQSRAWFPLQLIPKKEGNVLSSCGEISFFSASISSCSPFKMKPRLLLRILLATLRENRDH